MNTTNRSILITGGGSGIGLETARLFSAAGNRVLIIGRNAEKLRTAAAGLQNVEAFAADITDAADVERLTAHVETNYKDLSILVNNAGFAYTYGLHDGSDSFAKAGAEMLTNYLAIIRLNEKLLPTLKAGPEAAIVNVSSIVAFTPSVAIPTYSDSKAALHSYTQSLRRSLAVGTNVRVFEVMPPLVNTEFSKEIGGEQHGMPPADVAAAILDGIENELDEVYVGETRDFRQLFLSNPSAAFNTLNPA